MSVSGEYHDLQPTALPLKKRTGHHALGGRRTQTMVLGQGANHGRRAVGASRRDTPRRAATGEREGSQEACQTQLLRGRGTEETPKKPRATSSPQAGVTSPSALPWSILTRLFPPRMATRPCRHRGAQRTLGTGAHSGKPEASPPPPLSGLWRRAAGEPPGGARGRGWWREEAKTASSISGRPSGHGGCRWAVGQPTLGLEVTSLETCFEFS